MSKTRAQRRKEARRRRRQRQADARLNSVTQVEDNIDAVTENVDVVLKDSSQIETRITFTLVIQTVGIIPILALVSILGTHHLYSAYIPGWFSPIIENQVAILALAAGNAGIIGLYAASQGKPADGTLPLLIAALATTFAGFRQIGDSTAGHSVFIGLFILVLVTIFAQHISNGIQWLWAFVRSKRGIVAIVSVISVVAIAYSQSQNENYIRDWFLIPLGIILGIVVAGTIIWSILKLSFKYLPILYAWVSSRVRERWQRRRRKSGNEEID